MRSVAALWLALISVSFGAVLTHQMLINRIDECSKAAESLNSRIQHLQRQLNELRVERAIHQVEPRTYENDV